MCKKGGTKKSLPDSGKRCDVLATHQASSSGSCGITWSPTGWNSVSSRFVEGRLEVLSHVQKQHRCVVVVVVVVDVVGADDLGLQRFIGSRREEGLQAVLRARPDQKNKKRWWCFDCVQREVDVSGVECCGCEGSGHDLSTARGTLDAAGGQGGAFYLAAQSCSQLLQTCCVILVKL